MQCRNDLLTKVIVGICWENTSRHDDADEKENEDDKSAEDGDYGDDEGGIDRDDKVLR